MCYHVRNGSSVSKGMCRNGIGAETWFVCEVEPAARSLRGEVYRCTQWLPTEPVRCKRASTTLLSPRHPGTHEGRSSEFTQLSIITLRDKLRSVIVIAPVYLYVCLFIIIIIIIMKEFIVRLLQCVHEHRCITLSIKLKSVVK